MTRRGLFALVAGALAGRRVRRALAGYVRASNAASHCPIELNITASYDFEYNENELRIEPPIIPAQDRAA